MVCYRIEGLPGDPTAAAAEFYAVHLERINGSLCGARSDSIEALPPGGMTVVFPPADHTHRAWRLAAVQSLARESAPLRVNAVASDDPAAIASALAYIANAPGLTGQCLALDDTGAGGVIPSLA